MTVRFAKLTAEVDANDRLRLQTMAQRVLERRPALRHVQMRIDGRPAELYGRTERDHGFEPRLVLRGDGFRREVGPNDRDVLEALARA